MTWDGRSCRGLTSVGERSPAPRSFGPFVSDTTGISRRNRTLNAAGDPKRLAFVAGAEVAAARDHRVVVAPAVRVKLRCTWLQARPTSAALAVVDWHPRWYSVVPSKKNMSVRLICAPSTVSVP